MSDEKERDRKSANQKVSEKRGHGSDTSKPSSEVKPPSGSGASHHPNSSDKDSSDWKSG